MWSVSFDIIHRKMPAISVLIGLGMLVRLNSKRSRHTPSPPSPSCPAPSPDLVRSRMHGRRCWSQVEPRRTKQAAACSRRTERLYLRIPSSLALAAPESWPLHFASAHLKKPVELHQTIVRNCVIQLIANRLWSLWRANCSCRIRFAQSAEILLRSFLRVSIFLLCLILGLLLRLACGRTRAMAKNTQFAGNIATQPLLLTSCCRRLWPLFPGRPQTEAPKQRGTFQVTICADKCISI